MKVVVISHALVTVSNRDRWKRFAELYPQIQLTLVLPSIWKHKVFGHLRVIETAPEEAGNYEIIPLPTTHQSNWSWYWPKGLGRLLRAKRPDVIFVMQEEFTLCLHWTILMRKIWCPRAKLYFFSWQNMAVANKKFHKKIMWKLLCRETDGLLAGTKQIKDIFEQEGYPRPIYIQTEIGVNPAHFYPDERKRESIRAQLNLQSSFVIGFCGRFVPEKGIQDLIKACFSLQGDWKLLLVGDGPLREEIERRFQDSGLRDRLILVGEILASETATYYRAMDCLVLPSRTTSFWREQFGLVLAQAMLTKVSIIGSDSGAIPEVIGDERFIFPEGDVDSLSRMIQKLMNHEMGPFNFSKVDEYTVDKLAHQTYQLLIQ